MRIDTTGIFGWASPAAIDAAAPVIGAGGQAYLQSVEGSADTWQQLNGHYSGDGAAEILAVFGTVTPHADFLAQTAQETSNVLAEFAAGIRELVAERDQLLPRIAAANARIEEATQCGALPADPFAPPGGPLGPPEPPGDQWLPLTVAGLAARYCTLEEETAARLTSVVLGDSATVNTVTDLPVATALGVGAAALRTVTSRQTVTKVPTPTPVYRRYTSDAERLRHWARGRWITDGEWKVVSGYGFEFRPKVSKSLYNHSDWYRARVNANPEKWVPPSSSFKDLHGAAKGLKIGGAALTVVTAGFTIADERQDAYNELLQENPGMSQDQLNERANIEGAVKGGTKVGIDLAAAGAGAMIGTTVGGPVGTVVGAGIGIGISVVTSVEFDFLDGRTIKDAVADGAMDLVDGAAAQWKRLFGG